MPTACASTQTYFNFIFPEAPMEKKVNFHLFKLAFYLLFILAEKNNSLSEPRGPSTTHRMEYYNIIKAVKQK